MSLPPAPRNPPSKDVSPPLPLGPARQRDVASLRSLAQHRGEVRGQVRSPVGASWERSLAFGVPPDLSKAPIVWDENGLRNAQAAASWVTLAQQAIQAHHPAYERDGHIVSLFDGRARMLWADGSPRVLEGLARIHFRPGADWSERATGTNGPGTALASGRPVHVVGREHFCQGWEMWHCAAAPIRDPLTAEIRGILDVSGYEADAHPHTLALVMAIAAAVERGLSVRDGLRNARVLRELARIVERWPGERVVALDRTGGILGASRRAAEAFPVGGTLPEGLRDGLREAGVLEAGSGEAVLDLPGPVRLFPLLDGADLAGACLLLGPDGKDSVAVAPAFPDRVGGVPPAFDALLGRSLPLVQVRQLAARAATTPLPVLLLGESGTGKEVLARAIHEASPRGGRPFVAVNCAAVPGELAVGEFFGHVAGAFSGALRQGREGHFAAADGGTLFLDEVGELPFELQAALLRVLQEGTVTPLGCSTSRRVDVRILAATNRDLPRAAREGHFRQDLFHRLHVLALDLPPLRDRGDDVVLLARHFLLEAELELDRPGHVLDPEVLEAFRAWSWPGNVRELQNLLRRLVALVPGTRIGLWDLPAGMRGAEKTGPPGVAGDPGQAGAEVPLLRGGLTPAPLVRDGVSGDRHDPGSEGANPSEPASAIADTAQGERRRLEEAVRRSATMKEAAARLGVGRSTLYRWLDRHGLRPGRDVHVHRG